MVGYWANVILDHIACRLGIWALRRLFGECKTDVADEYPGENLYCLGCDSARMIKRIREVAADV